MSDNMTALSGGVRVRTARGQGPIWLRFRAIVGAALALLCVVASSSGAFAQTATNPSLLTADGFVLKSVPAGTQVSLVASVAPFSCTTLVHNNDCLMSCSFRGGTLRLKETSPMPGVVATATVQGAMNQTVRGQFSGNTLVCPSFLPPQKFTFNVTLAPGVPHIFLVDIENRTPNSNTVNLTWTKVSSTTSLTVLSAVAGAIQVRAQVNAFPSGPVATGTVAFAASANGQVFTISGPVSQGVATATFALPFSTAPTTISATYSGDSNLNTSQNQTTIAAIGKSNSSTSNVTLTPLPASSGAPVTLSATVTGYAPGGSVDFMNGNTVVASAAATNTSATAGSTNFAVTTRLSAGNYSLTASYLGDANNLPSSSATALQASVIVSPLDAAAALGAIINSLLLD